ncbi:MAG TPA: BTAD domain-containing putative transcriptional regulator, partial [Gemmatimonadaceae bacterium]|nr:BTAD domain-containing putative transcriptional regulator [Gemmatimonadaceae bacterium]
MLTLATLGTLHLTGQSAERIAGRRKVLALLAHLARRAPETVPRPGLIALFWADRDEVHAKQSLRQALVDLRPVLGDALETQSETVTLSAGALSLDVNAFEELVLAQQWSDAARLWKGDFLAGTENLGSRAWAAWLDGERSRLRASAARVFEQLVTIAAHENDTRAMLDAAVRWTEVAPLDEHAQRQRIEALVRHGRPIDAAVCYESFLQRLRASGHGEPSATFTEIRARFAADGAAVARRRAPGLLTLSTLAQLPVDARTIVEAAAVIGEPATSEVLQRITELTPQAFRAAARELAQRGIFAAQGESDERYDFTLEENRRRVGNVIPADRRGTLRRAVQARLGRLPGESPPEPAPEPRRRSREPRHFSPSRRMALGVSSVVIASATLLNWVGRTAPADALALAPGSRILLADVRNGTGEPLLDAALGTAAAVGLRQSRHVALVPAQRTRTVTRDSARGGRAGRPLDLDAARGIAVRDSVARVVSLDVQRFDSAYRLAARVIDPQSGEILREEQVEVRRSDLVDGLDGLLQRVRAALGESESSVRESSRPLRAVASPSLEALEAYTEGARAHALGNVSATRAAWLRALAADSTFALAELALADDAFERGATDEGDRWLRRAIAHAHRLSTIEALRARHRRALRGGNTGEAERLAAEILDLEPSSAAWFALAQAQLAGGDCGAASAALDSALVLDSLHVPSRLTLARCAAEQGDLRAAVAHHAVVQRADAMALARPAYAHAWGMVLVRAGRLAEAEAAFERLLTTGLVEDSLRG